MRFDFDLLEQKLAYWGDRCWLCGEPGPDTWDHVKPLKKGGPHMLANLRPAHRSCNSKRSAKWPFTPVVGFGAWLPTPS